MKTKDLKDFLFVLGACVAETVDTVVPPSNQLHLSDEIHLPNCPRYHDS